MENLNKCLKSMDKGSNGVILESAMYTPTLALKAPEKTLNASGGMHNLKNSLTEINILNAAVIL